eukprot:192778-Hanusia_phi.AAC.2
MQEVESGSMRVRISPVRVTLKPRKSGQNLRKRPENKRSSCDRENDISYTIVLISKGSVCARYRMACRPISATRATQDALTETESTLLSACSSLSPTGSRRARDVQSCRTHGTRLHPLVLSRDACKALEYVWTFPRPEDVAASHSRLFAHGPGQPKFK